MALLDQDSGPVLSDVGLRAKKVVPLQNFHQTRISCRRMECKRLLSLQVLKRAGQAHNRRVRDPNSAGVLYRLGSWPTGTVRPDARRALRTRGHTLAALRTALFQH